MWNESTSKIEIRNRFSGVMKKDTEIEVANYISYLLNSFFVTSEFSEEKINRQRVSCIWEIISDIHILLFKNRIKNFQFKFSFESLNLDIFKHNDFDNNSIYIGDLMDPDERSIFDVMIAKCLFFKELDKDRLLLFFCDELKGKFDKLLSDISIINSPKFKLEKVQSGFVPLFMFTDSQILNSIKEGENLYSFSTIKSIKKITSEEQFERFMNLLSQI